MVIVHYLALKVNKKIYDFKILKKTWLINVSGQVKLLFKGLDGKDKIISR